MDDLEESPEAVCQRRAFELFLGRITSAMQHRFGDPGGVPRSSLRAYQQLRCCNEGSVSFCDCDIVNAAGYVVLEFPPPSERHEALAERGACQR